MMKKTMLSILLLCGMQFMSAQDALTSVKVNLCNVKLSSDAKNISFDVYVQSVNKKDSVAIPGYTFRLSIPQSDIGSSEKVITVTNASKELGSTAETIVANGTDWLMKFLNENLILSYDAALVAKTEYPGSVIGSVKLSNADGSPFPEPITINLAFSGTGVKTKTTCSVFKPKTTVLAPNSTTALPSSNFTGLNAYTLYASGTTTNLNDTFLSTINGAQEMRVFDLYGKLILSKIIHDQTDMNLSSLPDGVYIVEVNGIKTKLVKR